MTTPASITTRDVVVAGHRNSGDGADRRLIERAAEDPDGELREAALGALLRIGVLDTGRLAGFCSDPEPRVRRRAAELAPRLDDPGATEDLLVSLLNDLPEIVEVAAFALGEVGSADGVELAPSTTNALESIVRTHADALCREAAVAALGALHTGLATILIACQDKATVRRRAVLALAPFDGPDVDAALEVARTDRDWQVRQAAEDLSDEFDSS